MVGKTGRDISQAEAESHIAGYGERVEYSPIHSQKPNKSHHAALAVDMTARNLQDEIKKKGLPWSAVKGFDTFTPIRFVPWHSIFRHMAIDISYAS